MVLIHYAYENTPCREPQDELRMLVTCYVADEGSKAIARSKQCLDLIEEGGAFARDLMSVILEDGNVGVCPHLAVAAELPLPRSPPPPEPAEMRFVIIST